MCEISFGVAKDRQVPTGSLSLLSGTKTDRGNSIGQGTFVSTF